MLRATATIVTRQDENGKHLYIPITWVGAQLDRPCTGGICLKPTHRSLAERLVRAIEAQAAHGPAQIKTDINGKTYVAADAKFMGRRLNADLKRLGY